MPEIRIIESDAFRSRTPDPAHRRGITLKAIESLGDESTESELCRRALRTLGADGDEIPFAMVYLLDRDRRNALLAGTVGIEEGTRWTPRTVDLESESGWPLEHVVTTGEGAGLDQLETRFGKPPASLRRAARRAFALPIRTRVGEPVRAILVVGVGEDEPATASFLRDAADRIAKALSRAHTRAAERARRAQAVLPGF